MEHNNQPYAYSVDVVCRNVLRPSSSEYGPERGYVIVAEGYNSPAYIKQTIQTWEKALATPAGLVPAWMQASVIGSQLRQPEYFEWLVVLAAHRDPILPALDLDDEQLRLVLITGAGNKLDEILQEIDNGPVDQDKEFLVTLTTIYLTLSEFQLHLLEEASEPTDHGIKNK